MGGLEGIEEVSESRESTDDAAKEIAHETPDPDEPFLQVLQPPSLSTTQDGALEETKKSDSEESHRRLVQNSASSMMVILLAPIMIFVVGALRNLKAFLPTYHERERRRLAISGQLI